MRVSRFIGRCRIDCGNRIQAQQKTERAREWTHGVRSKKRHRGGSTEQTVPRRHITPYGSSVRDFRAMAGLLARWSSDLAAAFPPMPGTESGMNAARPLSLQLRGQHRLQPISLLALRRQTQPEGTIAACSLNMLRKNLSTNLGLHAA
ncbi:hypothetical protein Amal_03374 [Acetobacter malorum]|uniref:Uncharacterized protein n=1 Tax=Acetobacter malorum TaxID=178901 RepID=A0A177G6L1_9PROT|nr:hypothetical protein Amal_03374 [Acetobacter malorum]